MVFVHVISSECALQMYKVSFNTADCYQSIQRARNSIANDPREIPPKYPKQSYGTLCMTRCLNVLYNV